MIEIIELEPKKDAPHKCLKCGRFLDFEKCTVEDDPKDKSQQIGRIFLTCKNPKCNNQRYFAIYRWEKEYI